MRRPSTSRSQARSWRWGLVLLATVLYVVVLAMVNDRGRSVLGSLTALLAVALALGGLRFASGCGVAAGWGLAVVVASLASSTPSVGLDVSGALGLFACTVAAGVALERIPVEGRLAEARLRSALPLLVLPAACTCAVVGVAISMLAASLRGPRVSGEDTQLLGWCSIAASGSVLVAWVVLLGRRRRLELGVVARANAMGGTLGIVAGASVVALLVSGVEPYALARLAVAVGGALLAGIALHKDPGRVARIVSRAVPLAIVGGAVALLGASAADGSAEVQIVTVLASAVCLVLGAMAGTLEGAFGPGRASRLDAFRWASREAIRADPDEAIRRALLAVRWPSGAGSPQAELWTLTPGLRSIVDAAGYLHQEEAEVPESMLLLAASEPEATVRVEVLEALEVRRPDLRPMARWMNERGAAFATVVACDSEVEGLLLIPGGRPSWRRSLSEVRAAKRLADHLGRACRGLTAEKRMLQRVEDATALARRAEQRALRAEQACASNAERHATATAMLAAPAAALYSAASIAALDALERRARAASAIAVVSPIGVDPVPFLARAHLAGPRRAAPFVVVDATRRAEHDEARWGDRVISPIALAQGGTLVLLDGAALPERVQRIIARAFAERKAPWQDEPVDVVLALTGARAPDRLVAQGRLDAALALSLGDARSAIVELPRLSERAADLRAIVTDRLASAGLRISGRPAGIEDAAYLRLINYSFPGEDAELAEIILRLVSRCEGDRVRLADVEALQLPAEAHTDGERDGRGTVTPCAKVSLP